MEPHKNRLHSSALQGDTIHEAEGELPPPGAADDLPEGLPGNAKLEAAGIMTLADVRALAQAGALHEIDGIGDVTEGEIKAAPGMEK